MSGIFVVGFQSDAGSVLDLENATIIGHLFFTNLETITMVSGFTGAAHEVFGA
jgi:hypothetical protein